MTAADIAAVLGSARQSGTWWRCKCPAHDSHGPTLALRNGGHGLIVKCFGGCSRADILAELRRRRLIDGSANGACPDPTEIARHREAEARARQQKIALAMDIWRASYAAGGTVVERYLRSRGLTLPLPPTLRYHPMHGCYGKHPTGSYRPQMIALVEHVEFGPVAASRTFLAPDGSGKATVSPVRIFTGPVEGGAVRLAPIQPDRPLALGEGIETTLSVMHACHLPGWAALSAIGIEKLILPPEARVVLICADHDANGAGERAAYAAADRWLREGRRVRIAMPPEPGTDFNDMLSDKSVARATEADNAA